MILSAAHREFARAGYHGASTASIARTAQCSEPMLYKHFASKELLFVAVLEAICADLDRRFDALIDAPGSLLDLWETTLPTLLADPRYAEMTRLRKLAISIIDQPDVHRLLSDLQDQHERRVAALVERGQREGHVRGDVDPLYVAHVWSGIVFNASYREALRPGAFESLLPHLQRFLATIRTSS